MFQDKSGRGARCRFPCKRAGKPRLSCCFTAVAPLSHTQLLHSLCSLSWLLAEKLLLCSLYSNLRLSSPLVTTLRLPHQPTWLTSLPFRAFNHRNNLQFSCDEPCGAFLMSSRCEARQVWVSRHVPAKNQLAIMLKVAIPL